MGQGDTKRIHTVYSSWFKGMEPMYPPVLKIIQQARAAMLDNGEFKIFINNY